MRTMNLEPTPEGYARIARKFTEVILDDVKKARQSDDRQIMVSLLKIVAQMRAKGQDRLFARLIVAIEQNENVPIMPDSTDIEIV